MYLVEYMIAIYSSCSKNVLAKAKSPKKGERCEQTVCRMMARGDIPAVKIGRRWYVSEARFNELLEVGSNGNDRR